MCIKTINLNLKWGGWGGEQMGTLGKNGSWGDATCICPRTCVPRPCSSLCMVTRVLALQVWLSSCLVVSGREDLSLHSVSSIQAADDYPNYTWDGLTLNLFCSTTIIVIHITAASFHFFFCNHCHWQLLQQSKFNVVQVCIRSPSANINRTIIQNNHVNVKISTSYKLLSGYCK